MRKQVTALALVGAAALAGCGSTHHHHTVHHVVVHQVPAPRHTVIHKHTVVHKHVVVHKHTVPRVKLTKKH